MRWARLPLSVNAAYPSRRVEQLGHRAAVCGAVAAEVEAPELRRAFDAVVGRLVQVQRDRQEVAAVGQIHPAPRRRGPLVGVIRRQKRRHLLDQVGGLGDHVVGCVRSTGVVLQCADGVDEPAVVGSTLGRWVPAG